MSLSPAFRGAGVAVLGLIAWSLLVVRGQAGATDLGEASQPFVASRPPQTAGGGSEVPCAAPLAWRVVRVDTEFGLSMERATAVVRQATELWQSAASVPLFRHDPENGFPIRFVHDERQERTQERLERQTELDQAAARYEESRAALEGRIARHNEDTDRHSARVRDFERRVSEHNAVVRGWNERGGAPDDVGAQLQAVGEALEVERRELEAAARPIASEREAIRAEERSLAGRASQLERMVAELERDFPAVPVESGVYREAIRRDGGRLVSVGREIRIFRFGSEAELRVIAAHELGHALGLGHVGTSGIMAQEQRSSEGFSESRGLDASDQRQLRAVCPGLARAEE